MRSKLTFRVTRVVGSLRNITPMGIINCLVSSTRGNDNFIDKYVIFASFFPLLLLTSVPNIRILSVLWPLGVWRIFEILIFLLNTLLFDDYRLALEFKKLKPLAGIRRPLILLVFNYIDIVFWFAFFYRLIVPELEVGSYDAWIESVNFSFVTLSAFGSHNINIDCSLLTTLTLIESILGLFVALAAVSSFVALIPQRKSSDAVEQRIERKNHSA